MKRIFTIVALSVFTMMNLSAEEVTLWEGDYNVSWELPDGDAHKEWKELGQADFAAMEAGQKLYFYFNIADGAEYHKYNFDNWSWQALPGHENEKAEEFSFTENTKVTFEVTQAIKDEIAANGFALHGHGFHVMKVTKEVSETEETINDIEATLLWAGEAEIDGWGEKSLVLTGESEGFSAFKEKLTTACNLYFLIENGSDGDFRIAGQWGEWAQTTFPSDGYNHLKAIDADCVVKVSLTQDFVTKAFVEKGGIAFWGNGGFNIKAIATTKEALLQAAGIYSMLNSQCLMLNNVYDLQGRKITKPLKGLYILNGKKYNPSNL